MSAIPYDIFFKRFGVKSPQYLMSPIMPSLEKFSFPKNSIHHYVVYDSVSNGPPMDEYTYRDISKKIYVEHALTLGDMKGSPKRLSVPLLPYIREYHNKNKRFRYTEDIVNMVKDENTLAVVNYGFVTKVYRYIRSYYTEYFKWWNIERTLWNKVKLIAETSERQQFIFAKLPKTLPPVTNLNAYSNIFNQQLVKIFNTPEYLFLLEIWKWMSIDNRKISAIGEMSQESYNKINVVFQESGKFIMINLGQLNSWRYDQDNPTEGQKYKIDAEALQKRFLRMLMILMETRTVVQPETDEEITGDEGEAQMPTTIVPDDKPETTVADYIKHHVPEHSPVLGVDLDESSDTAETRAEMSSKMLENLDKDLGALEIIESQRAQSIVIEDELSDEEKAAAADVHYKDKSVDMSFFDKDRTPEKIIEDICGDLADDGMMSAAEYRRYLKNAENYKNIVAPDGKTTLPEFIQIPPEDIKIEVSSTMTDIKTVVDKTMLKSSLLDFDEKYITKVMTKDVMSMGVAIQKAGIIMNKYEVEDVEDILGKYQIHSIRVTPIEGTPSTLRFRMPIVDEDGSYTSNGVKYRMRKQRGELPIRKVAPDKVSLSSYYGKTTVSRSDKKVHDYGTWLRNEIISKAIDLTDESVTNLVPADVFTNAVDLPRSYTAISAGIKEFTTNGFSFIFDYDNRDKIFTEEQIAKYEKKNNVLIGFNATDDIVYMDKNGSLYKVSNGVTELFGNFESLLNLDTIGAPVDFAQVKVYGKNIPLAVVMGYQYGLQNLLTVLKSDVRRVAAGQRLNLQSHEYALAFSDETLILSKDDALSTMVFAGFREYARHIKNYSVYTFDKPNVYLNILESNAIGARYLRELDLMDKLFVDPITKEILIEMKEPVTFRGLLIRSAELLLKDAHPDALDMEYMRIKGYERFAGAAYTEMVNAVREHNSKSGKSNYPIELNPYNVWKRITTDPAINLVSDINPIENIKQQESVTYSGVGGRMGRSMTKSSRAYHPNDMGVISESTSDSSDVAINTFTSADPQFVSLRGRTSRYVIGKTGPTALLSTSALMSVGSDSDDPKRVNFVGIQHSHGIACNGYTQSAVRTGYEQILAQRTGDLFAQAARFDGKVISKKNNAIVVQYSDGSTKGVELGRRYGLAGGGLTIAHDVISEMKEGDVFKKGDIIAYNTGFFEKDILNPKNVIWKMGVTAKTVLYESTQTHEDASSISKRLAEQLTTKITKVKTVVVSFDQEVKNVLQPGNVVEHRTILCTIEDAITSNANLFDENTLNTLKMLSNQTPTAKTKGVLERIEVYYHGEKEDMSPTLRALADISDRVFMSRQRALGKTVFTGSVNEGFRIEGVPLQMDTLAIRFYMTNDVPSTIGDKGVFANQMKTVFSEVMDYEMKTESGAIIDAVFGQKSIDDRIVNSALTIGTSNTLLSVIGKKAVEIYNS